MGSTFPVRSRYTGTNPMSWQHHQPYLYMREWAQGGLSSNPPRVTQEVVEEHLGSGEGL